MGRLADSTVMVLTGNSLMFIEQAAALARKLAPSVVVVEDVDLIAQDRGFSPMGNPLLFSLLDAMDGVAADADVTFVLTTNRVAVLEEALTQRPGRIDLAVEIPRPDAAGRRRLIELYAGGATVAADLDPVVAATEGATASAIKELMRRAVLRALEADPVADPPVVDDEVLSAVVAEFAAEAQALSRALLGAGRANPRQRWRRCRDRARVVRNGFGGLDVPSGAPGSTGPGGSTVALRSTAGESLAARPARSAQSTNGICSGNRSHSSTRYQVGRRPDRSAIDTLAGKTAANRAAVIGPPMRRVRGTASRPAQTSSAAPLIATSSARRGSIFGTIETNGPGLEKMQHP